MSGVLYFYYSSSVCTRTKDGHKRRCEMTHMVRHISMLKETSGFETFRRKPLEMFYFEGKAHLKGVNG